MSVQNQTPFNSYTANGATTVFPFTFLLLEAGDLVVELAGVAQTTGFSVSGIGAPGGGSVTFTVAPANGVKVLLKRVLTLQRLTDYQNNGDLLSATLNKDFDRIWHAMQQLQQNDIRALKLPFDTPTDQVIPQDAATRANRGVKFDASGNLILANFDPDNAQDDATAAAATATTQAGIATTQAGIATTKAAEATASAASIGFTITALQAQDKTAFTSAGAAPAFTVTTNPAYGAYATNQRMRVKFHAAGTTGSNTLNRDGLGAKNIMQYDATGTKVSGVVAANQLADVEYDGTDMVILDPLPPTAASGVTVRQTVTSGQLDGSGYANFISAGAGLSVNVNAITAAAANGFSATGAPVDRVGASSGSTNLSSLAANTTNYLYANIAANGAITFGATTLAPVYQWGGSYSTTNGQHTFNIQEMVMKVGNGSVASQAYRVFIGEAVTGASSVSSVVNYALMGRYTSGLNSLPGTGVAINMNHNIGVMPMSSRVMLQCQTAEFGYSVGDEVPGEVLTNAGSIIVASVSTGAKAVTYTYYAATPYLHYKGSANSGAITTGNWKIKSYAIRGW